MVLQLYESILKSHNLSSGRVQVFPLNSGGVNLVFEKKKMSLEIDISNDLEFSFLITDDQDFEEEGDTSFDKIGTLFQLLHFKK